ncbi:hypothetical protein [Parasitella parasitica]|uniref:UBC core domain-containing protein n=1 Tax=Parasitella parasitica TaxID=35722 RepID=A0A0B7NJ08_9FUNG|nr:hypothetical protein [Parasitella parasitica]
MASAASVLHRQLKELSKNPVPGFAVDLKDDNILEWDVALIGSPKTIYEGGYFKATMSFPVDYPFNPPTFRFNNPFYHPNVYPDGRLCISILHPPGEDPVSGEKAEERWNPTQVAYRKNREAFDAIVKKQVEDSKKDIPSGFQMPTSEQDFMPGPPSEMEEDDNFWYESGDDSDFGVDDYEDEDEDD